jgi:biopolymer transport protein ExbD
MSMPIGSASHVRAGINTTPMIDVLLVLIIIFMVITPLTPLGLDALVPQSSATTGPPASIVITALPDGSYLLNHEPLAKAALENRLMSLFRTGAATVVFVRGARDIEFRRVAETVDLARGVGVPRIGLMPD